MIYCYIPTDLIIIKNAQRLNYIIDHLFFCIPVAGIIKLDLIYKLKYK